MAAFKKGDVVVCVDNDQVPRLVVGNEYVVHWVGRHYLDVEGDAADYYHRRFKLKEEAAPVKAGAIIPPEQWKVGDKVYVTGLDRHSEEEMEGFVNDGVAYPIEGIVKAGTYNPEDPIGFRVYCGGVGCWFWLATSLRHESEVPGAKPVQGKAKAKKVRKPKKAPNVSLRVAMRKKLEEVGFHGLCSFGYKDEQNNNLLHVNAPCHYNLNAGVYMYGKPNGDIVELAYSLQHDMHNLGIDKGDKKDEKYLAYKQYVNYILNDSPWACCFLTKSFAVAERYDILMDVKQTRNKIAGACVALREAQEFGGRSQVFSYFLNKGFLPNTAYLLSCCISMSADKKTFQAQAINGGHMVLSGSAKWEDLVSFFTKGYTKDNTTDPYSSHHGGYSILSCIAKSTGAGQNFADFIGKNLKKTVEGEGFNKRTKITEQNVLDFAAIINATLTQKVEA